MFEREIVTEETKELGITSRITLKFSLQENTFLIQETKTNLHKSRIKDEDVEVCIAKISFGLLLTFKKKNFPDELKLIRVTEMKQGENISNQIFDVMNDMSPENIDSHFFAETNKKSILFNFLQYSLLKFLIVLCIKNSNVVDPSGRKVDSKLSFHPLVMEHSTWGLLCEYNRLNAENVGGKHIQIGVLNNSWLELGAVDMGGPTKQFVDDMSNRLFQYQPKKHMLFSLSRYMIGVMPCVSLLSEYDLFPKFFNVKSHQHKQHIVSHLLNFL